MSEPLSLSMLNIQKSFFNVHKRGLNYYESFKDKATETLKDLMQ